MRILHLIKHCNLSNGHVNVAVDLACVHARGGHAVALASAGGGYVEFLEANGIEHHTMAAGASPLAVARSLRSLLATCSSFEPDVIHAHMMSSAVLGFLASQLCRVPLVTTMHNSFDRHSGLMRLGDAVVAVSEAERKLLLSRGYPDSKVVTIRNGTVGSPRSALQECRPLPELQTPCVVTVCGLHPRKGVNHLIDAFARVAPAHPDWHLNIIGEGPDAARLEAHTAALGLSARVHFLGPVRNPKRLLQQADIFALASLAEPFGLVLLEGRAAGCAMVATQVGGIAEALSRGTAGQLVPPGNPEAMAAVFDRLMSSPEYLQAWRNAASADLTPFAVEQTAGKYLSLYERLRRRRMTRTAPQRAVPPA